jgi:hypothetical protein
LRQGFEHTLGECRFEGIVQIEYNYF